MSTDSERSEWRQRWRLSRYGLTPESFAARLEAQGGRCAICYTDKPGGRGTWHVDHDHECCGPKRACALCIRGLLCFRCNVEVEWVVNHAGSIAAYFNDYRILDALLGVSA